MESQQKLLGMTRRQFVASSASALAAGGVTAAFSRNARAEGVPASEQSDRQGGHGPVRRIIDTDPGVDDALAVLLAIRSPELQIAALTAAPRNGPLELEA